jgi:hypothetical protein
MTEYAKAAWPEPIPAFEEFLKSVGLTCLRRETDAATGSKLLQYASAIVGVRVAFDGCAWLVDVAAVPPQPGEWYDAALLRDLLVGGQSAHALPLGQQIEFVRVNWRAIAKAFDPNRRADTHMRLSFLRSERVKRRSAAAFSRTTERGAGSDVPEEKESRQHD